MVFEGTKDERIADDEEELLCEPDAETEKDAVFVFEDVVVRDGELVCRGVCDAEGDLESEMEEVGVLVSIEKGELTRLVLGLKEVVAEPLARPLCERDGVLVLVAVLEEEGVAVDDFELVGE